jgi:hypothetical protein
VRSALLPHLEPFVSTTLLPATGGGASAAAAAGATAAERELARREAQRLFGALSDAATAAMYDRLIGAVAEKLPASSGGGGSSSSKAPAVKREPGAAGAPPPVAAAGRAGTAGEGAAAAALADAWKEDSDVNAQLGALVGLFGEEALAQLPLGQLPCFNL